MSFKGGGMICNEDVGYVYVVGEHLFMQAQVRDWLLEYGYERFAGIARLDGGIAFWD